MIMSLGCICGQPIGKGAVPVILHGVACCPGSVILLERIFHPHKNDHTEHNFGIFNLGDDLRLVRFATTPINPGINDFN